MPDRQIPIRFGVFEVDLAAGELRRNGARIKLQEQPFQVLAALLERPGELVSKEELQERIWKEDTFVDFDRSLATAVNKVRQALGDSAANSRFIETVPKRGYRFLAQISLASPKKDRLPGLALICGLGLLAAVAAIAFLAGSRESESSYQPTSLTPTPVTSFPGFEYHPAISRDGTRVAFSQDPKASGANDIYVQTIDSSDAPIRLTDDKKYDFSPTWSPDGDYLAFVRFTPERSEIVRIPSIGGPETKLGELDISANFPEVYLSLKYLDWSPDGQFLAVAQHPGKGSPLLFELEVATGKQTPLSYPAVAMLTDPAYAPDGRTLAYAGFQQMSAADVWLQDLAESGEPIGEPLRATHQESFINGLDWAADGRSIVFSSSFENIQRLWRVTIESRQATVLQGASELGRSPSIASHSSRLVYARRDYDSDIWTLPGPLASDEDRGEPIQIASSTWLDGSVDFSADGRRIVFVSSRTGSPELWTSAADGSDTKRITSWNETVLGSPRWSPDGQFIAFDGNRVRDIYVVRSNGGQPRRLTVSDSYDIRPAWSRDGEWLYFASMRTGRWAIWKVPLTGEEPVQVTDDSGFEFFEAADGALYFHSTIMSIGDIWRRPAGEGRRERVLADIESTKWAGFDGGICFVKEANSGPAGLWFYDFSTHTTKRFGELPTTDMMVHGSPGLSVSPDGTQIVLSLIDRLPESDIMLLEGFR